MSYSEMPQAYSYVRFSDKAQSKGDSYRRQTALSDAYAKRHGLHLVKGFKDPGVSAFRGKNRSVGDLARFRAMVEDGRIKRGSWLLVESLDRLSRESVGEALPDFLNLLKSGIKIAMLLDERVYDETSVNDPLQLVGSLMIMSRAHEESVRKSQRISARWAERRVLGLKSTVCPSWLRLDGDRYQIVEERAATIRLIFDLAAGGMASHSICRTLNDRHIPLLSDKSTQVPGRAQVGCEGRRWHAASINKILRSRRVLGEHQPHRVINGKQVPEGDPIRDYFPVIVEPAVWQQAAAVRRKTGFAQGRRSRAVNLLQGVTYCDHCGGRVQTAMASRGDGYVRAWVCSDKTGTNHKCKGGRWFPYPEVEAALLDNIKELRLSHLLRDPTTDGQVRAVENEILTLHDRIGNLERRQARLMGLIEASENEDVEDLLRTLRERRTEIRMLKETIKRREEEREELVLKRDTHSNLEAAIIDIRESLKTADDTTTTILRTKLQQALKSFVSQVRFHPVTGMITVILVNGLAAYQFQQVGPPRSRGRPRPVVFVDAVNLLRFDTTPRREVFTLSPEAGALEDTDWVEAFQKVTGVPK